MWADIGRLLGMAVLAFSIVSLSEQPPITMLALGAYGVLFVGFMRSAFIRGAVRERVREVLDEAPALDYRRGLRARVSSLQEKIVTDLRRSQVQKYCGLSEEQAAAVAAFVRGYELDRTENTE